jgi:hypothetical protein
MNINELTETYMAIRTEREALSRSFKRSDEELKSQQTVIEQEMLKICAEQGADSIRTGYGTVSRQIKNRYHILDWDNFYEFVIEHRIPQLLTKRVHETNFNEFMQGKEEQGLPPGVNIAREYTITVYKPKVETASFNPELVA